MLRALVTSVFDILVWLISNSGHIIPANKFFYIHVIERYMFI
jgi:hypothetical protein